MVVFTRLALTLALLVVVWFNAHWSVALTLTLLALNTELLTLAGIIRRAAERRQLEQRKGF